MINGALTGLGCLRLRCDPFLGAGDAFENRLEAGHLAEDLAVIAS
jgi:hypothetical protein